MQNVLFLTLCQFIPIVGVMVVYGYQFEVIETLHRQRGRRYPDFKFDRFSEYLTRGLWVFLVALVANLVIVPCAWLVVFIGFLVTGGVASMLGPEAGGFAMLVTIPIFVLLTLAISFVGSIIMAPLLLRAGLTQDFGQAFDTDFAMQFIRNTWKQIIISTFVGMLMAFAATIAGLAMFCIGVYFTMTLMMLVYSHLAWQVYELHLSKGGSRIPLKTPVPKPGRPVGY